MYSAVRRLETLRMWVPHEDYYRVHSSSFLMSLLLFENIKCKRDAYSMPVLLSVSICWSVWKILGQLLWMAFVGSTLHVEQRENSFSRAVFMCDSSTWIRTLRKKLNEEKKLFFQASWFIWIKFVIVKIDTESSLHCIKAYDIATGSYVLFSLNSCSNWSPVTAQSSWNLIKGQEIPKFNFVPELLALWVVSQEFTSCWVKVLAHMLKPTLVRHFTITTQHNGFFLSRLTIHLRRHIVLHS